MSWTDSDEEETPQHAPKTATKPPKDDWSEDSDDDNNEADKPAATATAKPKPAQGGGNVWSDSDDDDDNANNGNAADKDNVSASQAQAPSTQPEQTKDDDVNQKLTALQLEALKKKLNKSKKNKKRRAKNKKNKTPANDANTTATAAAVPKNQDEVIEMSSEDSADDEQTKKKKEMQSYDQRMATDNDLLFEGQEQVVLSKQQQKHAEREEEEKQEMEQRAKQRQLDTRDDLSGQVTLKNFPLGSGKDCENLAEQVCGLLDQKLYEEEIKAGDVFMFLKKIVSSKLLDRLDMVDTKELATTLNSTLKNKQKAWQKIKDPKGKLKKKKSQWLVSNKFQQNQMRKGGHVEGQYDQDEFGLFD